MKKIVFVCTGNACRSAAAETVLKKMLNDRGVSDVSVTSVGTMDWGVNPRDAVMVGIAAEKGYQMEGTTTFMTSETLDAADLILVMTSYHRDKVTSQLKFDHWGRIHLFMDYCYGEDVPIEDPQSQTEYVYRTVFDKIEKGCERLADRLAQSSL